MYTVQYTNYTPKNRDIWHSLPSDAAEVGEQESAAEGSVLVEEGAQQFRLVQSRGAVLEHVWLHEEPHRVPQPRLEAEGDPDGGRYGMMEALVFVVEVAGSVGRSDELVQVLAKHFQPVVSAWKMRRGR